ncbi:MAG: radical SAM protein [Elusimicrobiota bacterium]
MRPQRHDGKAGAAALRARLQRRLGREGLEAALEAARRRRDPMGQARSLAAEGRMAESLACVVAALARPADGPSSPQLEDAARALSDAGWAASWNPGRGAGSVALSDGRPVADLSVDAALAGATGGTVTITPTVRLSSAPARTLTRAEKESLERFSTALYRLLESLRGQDGGSRVRPSLEVHEAGSRPDVILRTTFACTQRCPFCFVPHESAMVPDAEVSAALDAAAKALPPGVSLTVSGGEPLADPRLPSILSSARRRGIREFVLQTNMIGLDKPGAVKRLVDLGVTGYDVSFHSHRPAAYDRITGTRGLLPRAVRALRSLLAVPEVRVTACILINRLNYRHLPELMGFLGRLSASVRRDKPVEVCFSVMNGAGMNRAASLAVDLGKAAPYVWKALLRCKAEGVAAQRFSGETSLPPCIVPEPKAWCDDTPFSQDRVRYAEDFSGARGSVGHAKRPGCRACPHDAFCLGVPAEYARLFGLGALRPPRKGSFGAGPSAGRSRARS